MQYTKERTTELMVTKDRVLGPLAIHFEEDTVDLAPNRSFRDTSRVFADVHQSLRGTSNEDVEEG